MAWNFRKRIKIAPGVHLNFSKGGMSTSVGPRGAKLTFGKNGTYLHTGIPGTGLYSRTKLSGGKMCPMQIPPVRSEEDKTSSDGVLIVFAIILLLIGILFIIL